MSAEQEPLVTTPVTVTDLKVEIPKTDGTLREVTWADENKEDKDKDLLSAGVDMVVPDHLKPNADYLLRKLRAMVSGDKDVDAKLLTELSLQAMIIMSNFGGVSGGFKKEIVLKTLRQIVMDQSNSKLDLMTKSALILLLSDGGMVSGMIDNFVWASKQHLNFDGIRKFCGCVKRGPQEPRDFNQ